MIEMFAILCVPNRKLRHIEVNVGNHFIGYDEQKSLWRSRGIK